MVLKIAMVVRYSISQVVIILMVSVINVVNLWYLMVVGNFEKWFGEKEKWQITRLLIKMDGTLVNISFLSRSQENLLTFNQ